MQHKSIFLLALWLLMAYAGVIPPASAATDDVATGSGYLEPAIVNGGIDLPTVPAAYLQPAAWQAEKFKGPVHGVRNYEVTGYRLGWRKHAGSGNAAASPRRISIGKHHYKLEDVVEFDRSGRLMRRESYKNGIRDSVTLVSYNPQGSRTETGIWSGARSFASYDAAGRSIVNLNYHIAPGGVWHLVSRKYHHYDAAGREIAWSQSDREPPNDSHGTRHLNSAGKVTDEDVTQDGVRTHVVCQNDARRIMSYRKTVDNACECIATWRYDDRQIILRKDSFANLNTAGLQHEPLLEYYYYDLAGRLQEYDAFAWSYRLYPAGAPDYVEQKDPFVTKLNDPYLTVLNGGGPTAFLHDTPPDKQQGEPPLYLRKSYSYDQQGRLLSIACFDGNGLPCLQGHTFSGSYAPTLYAVLRYRYDAKGKPTWTMYDIAGKEVHDFRTTGTSQYTQFNVTSTWIISTNFDRHGNWTYSCGERERKSGKNPMTEMRKISYYHKGEAR